MSKDLFVKISAEDDFPILIEIVTGATVPSADVDLARDVVAGDRKAAAEFVERFSDPVAKYLRSRLTPRIDLVDDLTQEVFLGAWQGLKGFRGGSSLKSWMLGIARHKVEDYYRKQLREALQELPEDREIPEPRLGADILMDRQRQSSWTWEILAELPEHYGLALRWRYWEQRSASEMGQLTGSTEKAVERLLSRAREQFRSKWREREEGK